MQQKEVDITSPYREKGWTIDEICMEDLFTASQLAEAVRLARANEREMIALFVENDYERQFIRPWREDLAAAIRKG